MGEKRVAKVINDETSLGKVGSLRVEKEITNGGV